MTVETQTDRACYFCRLRRFQAAGVVRAAGEGAPDDGVAEGAGLPRGLLPPSPGDRARPLSLLERVAPRRRRARDSRGRSR